MLLKIVRMLMNFCERHDRVLEITGTAGPDDVYLIRYFLIRSKYLNVFIHQFLRSDRDDLHDHPWHFFTYLVRGSYLENKWNQKSRKVERNFRVADPKMGRIQNRLVIRKATDQHQVVVQKELKREQKDMAALTICVTGPKFREWGFIKEEPLPAHMALAESLEADLFNYRGKRRKTRRVWVDWKTYLGLPKDAPGRG